MGLGFCTLPSSLSPFYFNGPHVCASYVFWPEAFWAGVFFVSLVLSSLGRAGIFFLLLLGFWLYTGRLFILGTNFG